MIYAPSVLAALSCSLHARSPVQNKRLQQTQAAHCLPAALNKGPLQTVGIASFRAAPKGLMIVFSNHVFLYVMFKGQAHFVIESFSQRFVPSKHLGVFPEFMGLNHYLGLDLFSGKQTVQTF